jgi:GDP-L-fucose synthase
MKPSDRIFVAGHTGLVGSAILRCLKSKGYDNFVLRAHHELDLTRQADVERFFASERPGYVFLAAARVGGILANDTYRGEFIRDNLCICANVIDAAYRNGAEKLLFLGSSCIYPKHAPQPIREEQLLAGPMEPTNQPYAIAKIAGIEMVDAYRRQYGFRGVSVMPTNVYGPYDNFDPQTSHVLPALIHRFHQAKMKGDAEVTIWGTGTPRREFVHADDVADACVFVMQEHDGPQILNIGTGLDLTIADLAELVKNVVGFKGAIRYDSTKPDGTPRKWLDVSRLSTLGWKARIPLRQGLAETYAWYAENGDRA